MYKSLCLPSSGTGSCKKRGQDLIDNNKRVKVPVYFSLLNLDFDVFSKKINVCQPDRIFIEIETSV